MPSVPPHTMRFLPSESRQTESPGEGHESFPGLPRAPASDMRPTFRTGLVHPGGGLRMVAGIFYCLVGEPGIFFEWIMRCIDHERSGTGLIHIKNIKINYFSLRVVLTDTTLVVIIALTLILTLMQYWVWKVRDRVNENKRKVQDQLEIHWILRLC